MIALCLQPVGSFSASGQGRCRPVGIAPEQPRTLLAILENVLRGEL